eukprot:1193513-Prorocentrum_minimum.AAC.1
MEPTPWAVSGRGWGADWLVEPAVIDCAFNMRRLPRARSPRKNEPTVSCDGPSRRTCRASNMFSSFAGMPRSQPAMGSGNIHDCCDRRTGRSPLSPGSSLFIGVA